MQINNLLRAQELHGADLARLVPAVAIGGKDDAYAAAITYDVQCHTARSRGEHEVLALHHHLRHLRARDHHGGDLAEFEEHQWAVPAR